jgi:uncharacterized membrane protein
MFLNLKVVPVEVHCRHNLLDPSNSSATALSLNFVTVDQVFPANILHETASISAYPTRFQQFVRMQLAIRIDEFAILDEQFCRRPLKCPVAVERPEIM